VRQGATPAGGLRRSARRQAPLDYNGRMGGKEAAGCGGAELRIGTSGWHYRHWVGVLYPAGLPPASWLARYAEVFDTVELNNSFYRLPREEDFSRWRDGTPGGFVFAVKASRFITHVKRLSGCEEPLRLFLERAGRLGDKLGPVLFQLPPRLEADPQRLRRFLDLLPRGLRSAWEFRHPSWFTEEVYALLRERGACLCVADSPRFPCCREVTASFAFVRLHGGRELYGSEYSRKELAGWAGWIRSRLEEGVSVFIYFNNDARGYAVTNALALKQMMESA